MSTGKCPKCDKLLSHVKIENMVVRESFQTDWHGVSYCCPFCNVILSVQIDPMRLRNEIVSEIVKKLSK